MSVFESKGRICSVSITDHTMVSPTLAKVVVHWTGNPSGNDMAQEIAASLNYMASPVEYSYRSLTDNSAVGFVRYQPVIQPWNEREITASFKVLGSHGNIMMDTRDRTLWEIKQGPGGDKYLARHGNENLAELIESSVNTGVMGAPKLSRVTLAKAVPGEFAAFVNSYGDMDYGFVTHTKPNKCKVISASTKQSVEVDYGIVVSFLQVPVSQEDHQSVVAAVKASVKEAGEAGKGDGESVAYWRELYKLWEATGVNDNGLVKSFIDDVVHQVNSDTPLGEKM
jgi:hypothetical protein